MHVTSLVVALAAATLSTLPAAAGAAPPPNASTDGVIVWTSRAATGSEHLMIADGNGATPRSLTPPAAGVIDINAQVAPDGAWIAYEQQTGDTAEIRLIRPDGSQGHRLDVPCAAPCLAVVQPTWLSPTRLTFSSVSQVGDAPADVILWTVRLDGSQQRRLSRPGVEGVYEEDWARLSGDGTYLVFHRIRISDSASALFRMRPDGSRLQRLTPWRFRAEVFDLSTASQGRTEDLIVFESYGRGTSEETFVDLATVPATCGSPRACGRQLVWLTDNEPTGRRNANPQWSPDGRSLVFTDRPSFEEPDANIWTMPYGADRRTQISTYTGFDYRPAWGVAPQG